jgi:hypothetical protein
MKCSECKYWQPIPCKYKVPGTCNQVPGTWLVPDETAVMENAETGLCYKLPGSMVETTLKTGWYGAVVSVVSDIETNKDFFCAYFAKKN